MSFFRLLFSDFVVVVRIVGVGFLLRLGMRGFDFFLVFLESAPSKQKEKKP